MEECYIKLAKAVYEKEIENEKESLIIKMDLS